jgi:hypothetical protein
VAADPGSDAPGVAQDLPGTPIGAPGIPAAKPKRSRAPKAPANQSEISMTSVPQPEITGPAAQPARTVGPPGRPPVTVAVAVPAARIHGQPVQALHPPAQDFRSRAEATFAAAVAAFMSGRDAQVQRDLQFEDVPAPKRLAPFAAAIAATVQRDDADVAWGRLVLLYDPDGQPGWDGSFRLVAYIRAEVEPEIAADPLLGEVGWSWLSEALDSHVPGYAVPSGTVTRVITEGFGAKRDELPLTGFELRASWSPAGPLGSAGAMDLGGPAGQRGAGPGQSDLDTLDLSAHIAAWCDCLSAAAGLEPPGTRALRQPGCG